MIPMSVNSKAEQKRFESLKGQSDSKRDDKSLSWKPPGSAFDLTSLEYFFACLDKIPSSLNSSNPPGFDHDFMETATFVKEPAGRHFVGKDITIVIVVSRRGRLEPSSLMTMIEAPSGALCELKFTTEDNRILCVFRSLEIGNHTCIFNVDGYPLPGSPFQLVVHRDYATLEKPIISITQKSEPCKFNRLFRNVNVWGITCNTSNEQILIADGFHNDVVVFEPDGTKLLSFGGHGTLPGFFHRPSGIAYDSRYNRVFVTDKENHRVQVFTPDGMFISLFGGFGQKIGMLYRPWGIAVSKFGEIVVADSSNHRVQLFNAEFRFLRMFQPEVPANVGFLYPRGIAFDPSADWVYVSDYLSNSIYKIPLDFSSAYTVINSDLERPAGLAVDDSGNLLVEDSGHGFIKVFSAHGEFLHTIKQLTSNSADLKSFRCPTDIAVMRAGFIAIADLTSGFDIM